MDGKFANPMYNKGYDDGYADGMARSDTLLIESIANYIIVQAIMGKRTFLLKELCRHFEINKPYMEGLEEEIKSLVNYQFGNIKAEKKVS